MTSKKDALNRGMHAVEQAGYRLSGMAIALLLAGVCLQSPAQAADKSGKEVYEQSCSQCHATGANGAPKVGDEAAWKKLSSQSLTSLTGVVLTGIRKMPPHGANMTLSDTELKRAVTYMVNQSGGKWIEPVSKKQPAAARTGEQVVKMRCSKCHETGKGGAPKIGDRQAWIPRLKDGLDATVRSAINGHGGMPARAGMPDLTDAELKDAITYMINKGRGPVPAK